MEAKEEKGGKMTDFWCANLTRQYSQPNYHKIFLIEEVMTKFTHITDKE